VVKTSQGYLPGKWSLLLDVSVSIHSAHTKPDRHGIPFGGGTVLVVCAVAQVMGDDVAYYPRFLNREVDKLAAIAGILEPGITGDPFYFKDNFFGKSGWAGAANAFQGKSFSRIEADFAFVVVDEKETAFAEIQYLYLEFHVFCFRRRKSRFENLIPCKIYTPVLTSVLTVVGHCPST